MTHGCLACGSTSLELKIDFWNFPYSCGASAEFSELRYPFQIGICKNCGLIQQMVIPDPNILYSITSHEGVWAIWEWHYDHASDFILRHLPNSSNNSVLEIWGWSWKIIDKLACSDKIKDLCVVDFKYRGNEYWILDIRNGLFEDVELSDLNWKVQLIYSSHVFEHITDFWAHLRKCAELLSNNGRVLILLPNFEFWIKNNFLNAFVQEHNIYPTVRDISVILAKYGFKVEEVEEYSNHSVYLSAVLADTPTVEVSDSISQNERMLKDFYDNLLSIYDRAWNALSGTDYYLFGAHIFSQLLLFSGRLNMDRCLWIFDNAKFKQGKMLYWTRISVLDPVTISELPHWSVIMVNAGAYTDEIKAQIKSLNAFLLIQ